MIEKHPSHILRAMTRVLQPLLVLFGWYVLFHGHESPGGGFQAGTVLAAATILEALTYGSETPRFRGFMRRAYPMAALGGLLYVGPGWLSLFGGPFLDYAGMPLAGMEEAQRRWWGIFTVEVGVCLLVWHIMVAIFDRLYSGAALDG